MLVEVLFWVFASVLAISALAMITVRNPVHAALLLVLCFFTSAAIWLLIEAEFLAVGERYEAMISADKAADAPYR